MPDKVDLYFRRMLVLDANLCVRINRSSRYRAVRNVFRLVSRLGDGVFWYALMAMILIYERGTVWLQVLHIALTGLVGTLIYKWLKGKTLRPRPYEVHQDIWLSGKPLDKFSFPSGHTLHAVAFSGIIMAYYPFLAGLVMSFTMMVAMSRVVLGLHYPSDVLAGAAIGAAIATISIGFIA